jgi:predicted nuclease of predicted toxin-antitoxin system
MRLIADVHISPRTVQYLNNLGHETVRVSDVLPAEASDEEIVARAIELGRAILSHDLDFPKIIMRSGLHEPSLVSLRIPAEYIENINRMLGRLFPKLEQYESVGIIVAVRPGRFRVHKL